jgi:hypothetical protein
MARKISMKTIALIFSLVLAFTVTAQAAEPTDYVIKHEQMLYSVVLVQLPRSSGSGTVIWSGEHEGKIRTYILTNHHVVKAAISVSKEWSSKHNKEIEVERRTPVEAYWFTYINHAVNTGKRGQRANIVAYSEQMDLALIQLLDTENVVSPVAPLMPSDSTAHLMERVWAIGSGLGRPPFATSGHVAYLDGIKNGRPFLMSTAPIVWGNSGGALFLWSDQRSRYELLGVPSRIEIVGFRTPIFGMAWSIPSLTIYEFLDENCFSFITGNEAIDECKEDYKDGE